MPTAHNRPADRSTDRARADKAEKPRIHTSGAGAPQPQFVAGSDCMRKLRGDITSLGRRHCTVLIRGESGFGKECVARQIHADSPRAGGPFVPVDCTTLRDTLFESQLFGHTKGAFTGADSPTLGFFRSADGGTLFLDEIGELQLHMQAKLLRCIQDSAVVPLGGITPIQVDARILVATHRDLFDMVRRGEFRQDLYYRLNVASLQVPALRQRKDDIPLIAGQTLDDLSRLYDEPGKRLSATAMDALLAHDWPGNVRELLNAIEHAFVFCNGRMIELDNLPDTIRAGPQAGGLTDNARIDHATTLEAFECNLIAQALRLANGNQSRAARQLGMERHRLHRRILLYGLSDLTRPMTQ